MSPFFDAFFVFVAITVASLATIDWLLGAQGRKRLKEQVGDFWTFIQYNTLDAVFVRGLLLVRKLLVALYGQSLLSVRFVVLGFLTNALVAFALLALVAISGAEIGYIFRVPELGGSLPKPAEWPELLLNSWDVALFTTVGLLASGTVSLASLILALRNDVASDANWSAIGIAFAKLIGRTFAFLCLIVAVAFIGFGIAFLGIHGDLYGDLPGRFSMLQVGILGLEATIWPLYLWAGLLVSLAAVKVARPIMQPVVSIILDRLYQSERGVLTQAAIALGALAKLVQELSKYVL